MRLYNRGKGRVCAEKEKSVFIVKRRERGYTWVYWRITEERVYQTFKIISNGTSFYCRKEEWIETNGTGL